MPRRTPRKFYVFVRDLKRKELEIFGPTDDDGPQSDAVARENERGRDMIREAVELGERDTTLQWAKSEGYRVVSGILRVEAESPSLYKGPLPQYAQGADRERGVRLFCKGDCGEASWAEMIDEPYPGKEAFKAPEAATRFKASAWLAARSLLTRTIGSVAPASELVPAC